MNEENLFKPIPVVKLLPEEKLPCDIYLLVDDKYIKFKHAGDHLPMSRHEQFMTQNLVSVYLKGEDFKTYIDWMTSLKKLKENELITELGEENRESIKQRELIKEKVYETFIDQELDSEKVSILEDQVSEFVAQAATNQLTLAVLAKFPKYTRTIVEHSVNVANLAVFIAMAAGHSHQYVLENVYLGALFHDYGMIKVPENALLNKQGSLYTQYIQEHPLKGAAVLKKIRSIPEPVLAIIEQHHEQFNGEGFPKGLKGSNIYELAQIVSLANYIDDKITEGNKRNPKKFPLAIKAVEINIDRLFDPTMATRAMKALKIAVGGKENDIKSA